MPWAPGMMTAGVYEDVRTQRGSMPHLGGRELTQHAGRPAFYRHRTPTRVGGEGRGWPAAKPATWEPKGPDSRGSSRSSGPATVLSVL